MPAISNQDQRIEKTLPMMNFLYSKNLSNYQYFLCKPSNIAAVLAGKPSIFDNLKIIQNSIKAYDQESNGN